MKMHTLSLVVVLFSFTAACKTDEQKTSFVSNCAGSQEQFTQKLCSCIFENVKDDFSEQQVARISGLFRGNVPDALSELHDVRSESDMDIYERFNSVEGATEPCFKQSG